MNVYVFHSLLFKYLFKDSTIQAITSLVYAITDASSSYPCPETHRHRYDCQFNKLKPPEFLVGANPLRYEEWVRKLENLFEIMKCPERFRVALATYQFEGEVKYR